MNNKLKDFHHYKGQDLSRFEKVERRVIDLIQESKIDDSKREDSIVWEFMHASGCMQIGRLLAEKRNLDVDIASVICVLHDIYTIVNGTYKNHGPLGAQLAEKILLEIGEFTDDEIKIITDAVYHHSEKEIYSKEPYVELVKDVDVFDCSLYKNAEGFYKLHKPEAIYNEYASRIKKIREELGLSPDKVFR
ncbi:HD domain-containing protein [Patescibacteria group bacterium]|nr:HD domain-containing protein [Patescibacteria group bacterium]